VRQMSQQRRQPGSRVALLTLTFVNLLNFMDRYVASAVKELLEADLDLTDAESALPTTGMVVVFMLCSLAFGLIVDREWLDRRRVMCVGVFLWSVATAAAGLAQNLWQLVLFRSLVGVGEASYAVVAGPMLVDFYPPHERTIVFAIYALAGPIGGAIGYLLGAVLSDIYGWRAAFAIVGVPGVVVALSVLCLEDPPRGINDDLEEKDSSASGLCRDLASIVSNPHWAVSTIGQVTMCFAIGGMSDWGPSWLQRYHRVPLKEVGIMGGGITAVAGIVGNLLGAKTTQALAPSVPNAGFLASGAFAALGGLVGAAALNVNAQGRTHLIYVMLLAQQTCMFAFMAPMGAICMSAIPVELRGRSNGIQILLTHILGDVISPPIIGAVSDRTGSLTYGMQLIWVSVAITGASWLAGFLVLPPLALAPPPGGKGAKQVSMRSVLCGQGVAVDSSDEASTSQEEDEAGTDTNASDEYTNTDESDSHDNP